MAAVKSATEIRQSDVEISEDKPARDRRTNTIEEEA